MVSRRGVIWRGVPVAVEVQLDYKLPDGLYPFADTQLPLSEMAMMEAPLQLEELLRKSALNDGVEIIRDRPVELRCTSDEFPDATFLVFWPSGHERLNILAPKAASQGRA
jgi:hypothetical protein